jgi:hypothetical protein
MRHRVRALAESAVGQEAPELLLRTAAALTAGYGALLVVRPAALAKPAGLTVDGAVPAPLATLTRSIGVRDIVLSLLAVVAPAGRPLAMVTAARVVADATDALWFARMLERRSLRAKVSGAAAGWAVLQAAAGAYAWRRRARHVLT